MSDDQEDSGKDDDNDKKPQTFSQADVNRIMAREKREGKASALKDLVEELELDSVDDLKKIVSGKKTANANEEQELAKLREDYAKLKIKHDDAVKNLAETQLSAKIIGALIEAGLDPKAARKASRLVEVDAGAEDDEITGVVDDLKKEMPQLFASAKHDDTDDDKDDDDRGSQNRSKDDSDVGTPPRKKGKEEGTVESRASDRLHKMYPDRFKSTTTTP